MKNKESKNIKTFLKPRAGKIRQGYFRPANPAKYVGDPAQIIFRSSWEFKFLKWCDSSPTVINRLGFRITAHLIKEVMCITLIST